ncbi:MAG TPA: hypothetical protein PK257_02050 [Candidatus Woesebacteria bacterium]|nr:hypothetical protein [Candidatus Woesebacteria bacterium]
MSETKKETKKINLSIVIVLVLVALGLGFTIGTLVQRNKRPNFRTTNGQQFQTGTRQLGDRTNGTNLGFQKGGPSGQNNASGEVIKIDDSSITIKTQNGGSKLIMISGSTIYKQLMDTDKSKLQVGSQIIVDGEAGTDGSITGKTISIN